VLLRSSTALGWGVLVPIPTLFCAFKKETFTTNRMKRKNGFIVFYFIKA
jgi:hypothetical protein